MKIFCNNWTYYVLALYLICNTNCLYSQDFENYTPLQCSGTVPDDFKKKALDKYVEGAKAIKSSNEKELLLNSSLQINDLLFSGRVLFGDPTTVYVNKIADKLLENDPDLRKKLRFYVLKSDAVNAFTTHEGIIFINLGLLAQVTNEAEIAFVIAHEIGHFAKGHVLKGYLERAKIAKGKGNYATMGIEQKIEEMYKYSKENEAEADEYGFQLYKKSPYSFKAINSLFDVLLYSYLPFDEIEFEYSFLEDSIFKIPNKHKLANDKKTSITGNEDEDDLLSTHPNIKKRKARINALISNEIDKNENKLYIIGENEFEKVQKLARFEVCYLYINEANFTKAFYSGWLLTKLYPEKLYANKIILMSIFGLSMARDNNHYSFIQIDTEANDSAENSWSKIEGSSQAVYYLLHSLKKDEITSLAARLAWKLRSKYPSDRFINSTSKYTIRKMVKQHVLNSDSFIFFNADSLKLKNDTTSKLQDKKDFKAWSTIFVSLDSNMKLELKNCFKYMDGSKSMHVNDSNNKTTSSVQKIMMLTPAYVHMDRQDGRYFISPRKSEKGSNDCEDIARNISTRTKLEVEMIDLNETDAKLLAQINMNNQMICWLRERLNYDNIGNFMDMELFESQYIEPTLLSSGTDYMGITVVRTISKYGNNINKYLEAVALIPVSLLSPLACIWGGGSFANRGGYTEYAFVAFNIRNNEKIFSEYKYTNSKVNHGLITYYLYNSLKQIKKQ